MSYVGLSKDEGDSLYLAPKIVDNGEIRWEPKDKNHMEVTIVLQTTDGVPLTVRGWYAFRSTRRYGFALLFKKGMVVRRWDDKSGHRDPITGKRIIGPHKHYCDPDYDTSPCFETQDVRAGDVDGALMDFLRECNISLEGIKYQRILEGT